MKTCNISLTSSHCLTHSPSAVQCSLLKALPCTGGYWDKSCLLAETAAQRFWQHRLWGCPGRHIPILATWPHSFLLWGKEVADAIPSPPTVVCTSLQRALCLQCVKCEEHHQGTKSLSEHYTGTSRGEDSGWRNTDSRNWFTGDI